MTTKRNAQTSFAICQQVLVSIKNLCGHVRLFILLIATVVVVLTCGSCSTMLQGISVHTRTSSINDALQREVTRQGWQDKKGVCVTVRSGCEGGVVSVAIRHPWQSDEGQRAKQYAYIRDIAWRGLGSALHNTLYKRRWLCQCVGMARPLRIEFPGAIYHVTCRMVGEAPSLGSDWVPEKCLFRDNADRERFLDRLSERVEQYQLRLFLFVCMTNHFHLVFETPGGNCSKFMQSLSTAYTVYYNLRHGRHGHLLDGRYKAKLVEGDDYLLALSRYVHLNPVQAGALKGKPIKERIEALRSYSWSSYPSYIGECKALDFVEYEPVLSGMPGHKRDRLKRYRKFVETGLAESDDDFKAVLKLSPRSIGGDDFRAWIDELYQKRLEKHARPEDASFRHLTEPLPAADVLAVLGEVFEVDVSEFSRRRHASPLRAVAARFLIRYAGLSQRDVADLLHIGSGAAVCNQLTRFADKLAGDRRIGRAVHRVEELLEARKLKKRN